MTVAVGGLRATGVANNSQLRRRVLARVAWQAVPDLVGPFSNRPFAGGRQIGEQGERVTEVGSGPGWTAFSYVA